MPAAADTLQGCRVLITGASSGLGVHFAQLLTRQGAAVALAARRIERLAAVRDDIVATGGTATAVAMDVVDERSVQAGYDAAEAAIGPINAVVANAGMSVQGSALDLVADAFDRIMAVNVRGAFLTAREGARRMIARGESDGRIVLVASIGGLDPLPGVAAYSTSKAAVVMLGRSLAKEWARRGINVNVLCPGFISTELNAEWFESEGGLKQIARFPRRRLMHPTGLDATLTLLLDPGAASITGSVFKADDGQML